MYLWETVFAMMALSFVLSYNVTLTFLHCEVGVGVSSL